MSLHDIQTQYGVPATLGATIRVTKGGTVQTGTITGARGKYLLAQFPGVRHPEMLHPTWQVEYLSDTASPLSDRENYFATKNTKVHIARKHYACDMDYAHDHGIRVGTRYLVVTELSVGEAGNVEDEGHPVRIRVCAHCAHIDPDPVPIAG